MGDLTRADARFAGDFEEREGPLDAGLAEDRVAERAGRPLEPSFVGSFAFAARERSCRSAAESMPSRLFK